MKVPIIYFSSSGNTKYICELVAKGFNSMDIKTELIPVKKIVNSADLIQDSALFGIGSPVYGGNFTPNIIQWMKEIPRTKKGQRFFLIDTNAGISGTAILKAHDILAERGYIAMGGLEIVAPTRDSVFWMEMFKYVSWNQEDLQRAFNFGRAIAKKFWTGNQVFLKSFRLIPFGGVLSNLFKHLERPIFRFATRFMAHNPSKCKKCKICESICPMDAINVKDHIYFKPEKCMLCFKCMRHCPEGALYLKIYPNARFYKGPFEIKGYIKPAALNF